MLFRWARLPSRHRLFSELARGTHTREAEEGSITITTYPNTTAAPCPHQTSHQTSHQTLIVAADGSLEHEQGHEQRPFDAARGDGGVDGELDVIGDEISQHLLGAVFVEGE